MDDPKWLKKDKDLAAIIGASRVLKRAHAYIDELQKALKDYKSIICKDCCGNNCTCEETLAIDAILNRDEPPEVK